MAARKPYDTSRLKPSQAAAWQSIERDLGDGGVPLAEREKQWRAQREALADEIEKEWPNQKGKKQAVRALRGEKITFYELLQARCYVCQNGEPSAGCASPSCVLFDFQREEWKVDYSQGWLR